jgi:hypothetical protein
MGAECGVIGTPAWLELPAETQPALTSLMPRLILEHADKIPQVLRLAKVVCVDPHRISWIRPGQVHDAPTCRPHADSQRPLASIICPAVSRSGLLCPIVSPRKSSLGALPKWSKRFACRRANLRMV